MYIVIYFNTCIIADTWVVVNTSINMLGNLVLEGTLEFANYPGAVYELNANNIIIMGGRLIIGWPDDPFLGEASIILRGNHSSPNYVAQGSGPTIGSKALGKTPAHFLTPYYTLHIIFADVCFFE